MKKNYQIIYLRIFVLGSDKMRILESIEKNENMIYKKLCSLFMLTLEKMFEGNYTKMGFTNHRNKVLYWKKCKKIYI